MQQYDSAVYSRVLMFVLLPQQLAIYAAFHWAQKLVITTFPVGFSVPCKSEVVNTTRKLQPHRVSDF